MGRKLSILGIALALTFFAMVIALLLSVPVPAFALILVSGTAFVLAVVSALLRRKVRQQAQTTYSIRRTHAWYGLATLSAAS
jgi:uncharacterized membrane protein